MYHQPLCSTIATSQLMCLLVMSLKCTTLLKTSISPVISFFCSLLQILYLWCPPIVMKLIKLFSSPLLISICINWGFGCSQRALILLKGTKGSSPSITQEGRNKTYPWKAQLTKAHGQENPCMCPLPDGNLRLWVSLTPMLKPEWSLGVPTEN